MGNSFVVSALDLLKYCICKVDISCKGILLENKCQIWVPIRWLLTDMPLEPKRK